MDKIFTIIKKHRSCNVAKYGSLWINVLTKRGNQMKKKIIEVKGLTVEHCVCANTQFCEWFFSENYYIIKFIFDLNLDSIINSQFWQFIDAGNDRSDIYITKWTAILRKLKWSFKRVFKVVFERFNFIFFRAAHLRTDFLTLKFLLRTSCIHFRFRVNCWTWFERIVKLLSIFTFVDHTFEYRFFVLQQFWCVIKFNNITAVFFMAESNRSRLVWLIDFGP